MATTKNLCAQIPIDLHERVSEERERLGQTTSEYIANLIQEYYDMIENQKGGIQMTEKGRTMAFQIPEELFQRIKRHLERETLRTGKKLTQRDFVLNLITQALDEADAENTAEQNTPSEAPVAPRVADVTAPADTDTPNEDIIALESVDIGFEGVLWGDIPVRKYNKIKGRSRKRPRPAHKAPQCGAFRGLETAV